MFEKQRNEMMNDGIKKLTSTFKSLSDWAFYFFTTQILLRLLFSKLIQKIKFILSELIWSK